MITPRFNVTIAKQEGNYTEFVCEPLEGGFGHTVGNALRRVLLSSIPGHAITSAKIKGVEHQFSTLPGLKEDVVDLLLNLKGIRLKSTMTDEFTMTLSAKGGEVTAGDVRCPAGVEIANPDHYLATLEGTTELEITLTANQGVGYSTADSRETDDISGTLLVDAVYTPIMKVAYTVEETRVGRRTDFDRLIMQVWTNGTVDVKEALDHAAEILISHFGQVINPTDVLERSTEPVAKKTDEVSRLTIEELDLPTRIANALRKGGYSTVGDLSEATEAQVSVVKNLGAKSVDIVTEALEKVGATFKEGGPVVEETEE